jgi:hypothetical protein
MGCGTPDLTDLAAFEQMFGSFAPRWMTRDIRLIRRFQRDGGSQKRFAAV